MFGRKGNNKQSQKSKLAELGIDPSLLDDPDESADLDFGPTPDQIKPLNFDVSSLLSDKDIHVELDPEDLEEGSDLQRELLLLESEENSENIKSMTLEEQINTLEKQLKQEKETAVFFKQSGDIAEAKAVLPEIRRLTEQLNNLKLQLQPTPTPISPQVLPPPTKLPNPAQSLNVSQPSFTAAPVPQTQPTPPQSTKSSGLYSQIDLLAPSSPEKPSVPQETPVSQRSTPTPPHSTKPPSEGLYSQIDLLAPSSPEKSELPVQSGTNSNEDLISFQFNPTQNSNSPNVEEKKNSPSRPELSFIAEESQGDESSFVSCESDASSEEQPKQNESPPKPPGPTEIPISNPVHQFQHLAHGITDEDLEAELEGLGGDSAKKHKLQLCEKYSHECHHLTLENKAAGNKPAALAWFRYKKLFDRAIEILHSGQDPEISQLVIQFQNDRAKLLAQPIGGGEGTPDVVRQRVVSGSSGLVPSDSNSKPSLVENLKLTEEEKRRIATLTELEIKLQAQIDEWMQRAMKCKNEGENAIAVKYYGEKKKMAEDLKKLKETKEIPGIPIPQHEFTTYTHVSEVQFRNLIAPEELEVAVVEGKFAVPGVSSLDTYVVITCPVACAEPFSVKTKKIPGNEPVYKDAMRFKIERNKTSFHNAIKRKKLIFEVFQGRWLRGDMSLGRGELLIDAIKTKAELRENVSIFAGGRRNEIGKLLVRIRVCFPLTQKHLIEEKTQFLEFKKHFTAKDIPVRTAEQPITQSMPELIHPPITQTPQNTPSSPSTLIPSSLKPPQPAQTPQNPPKQPAVSSVPSGKSVNLPASSAPVISAAKNSEPEEEVDYNPVENMISNDVLEWALESVNKQIKVLQATRKPVPDELETRRTQIDAKLQVLMIQVQTGTLSEEVYVDLLQKKIVQEKQAAQQFLRDKNEKAAKFALTRAKIMTKELEGEEE